MPTEPALYQVIMMGSLDERATRVRDLVQERVRDLGLPADTIKFVPEATPEDLNSRLPAIGIFFGYAGVNAGAHPLVDKLVEDSSTIISAVSSLKAVKDEIPEPLRHINAIELVAPDLNFDRVASLVLESFRLLRRERRLFISYKRDDSQAVADQLYDALDARGFDVFIDTRSVPPAVDFQEELWHRLSDSDVVILIDTPGFRSSRWTTEELARANATNIQILHLLWPGQVEDAASAFSYFHFLEDREFSSRNADGSPLGLSDSAVDRICRHAEQLRARAIAARYRYLVDSFCDAARDQGLPVNVQPQRWISVDLPSGKQLAAVPTIGTPTSDRINAVFNAISAANGGSGGTWALYDGRGMLGSWLSHLSWLDEYLPVKSVSMARADQALKDSVR